MPRSNWKGYVSFGLVNIPIVLFPAENPSEKISFRQIDKKTGSKIKYKRVNADTDKEVAWEDIGKGYEYEKDQIIPLADNELKKVAGENARTIAIESFVKADSIQHYNIYRTYYLEPDKNGDKGYVILREALKKSGKVGIAKVIISTKEYLAAVDTLENALVIYLLHYDDEMRKLSDLNIPQDDLKKYKIHAKEIEIAKKLIDSMTTKWTLAHYKDDYKEAIEHWLEQKMKNLPESSMPSRTKDIKSHKKVVDFVELLRKSLASASGTKKSAKKIKKSTYVKKPTVPTYKSARH